MSKFASLRLGKTSVEDIRKLVKLSPGIRKSDVVISVKCTQVPQEFEVGTYVFIWLGSDNNKGIPTEWKQGYQAIGKLQHINRGEKFNDESTSDISIEYIFENTFNRLDILSTAPKAYYLCSALPVIGLDDHSNQTIRLFNEAEERCDIKAFFSILTTLNSSFQNDALKIDASWGEYLGWKPSGDIIENKQELENKVRDSFAHFVSLVNLHTSDFSDYIDMFEKTLSPYIAKLDVGYNNVFQIVDYDQYNVILDRLQHNFVELAYLAKERENSGNKYMVWTTHRYYRNFLSILASANFRANIENQKKRTVQIEASAVSQSLRDYLRAMRTKPFLLLAGISGTGKSRIVKQLAYKSCPDNAELRKDTTSPGNYCLIEVKPNWHDSTELLGYRSQIGTKHYVLTSFIKFLVKAMLYSDTPFFVCLDEMNLAPVEQYFAEFLSVLESRKKKDGHITSEALIEADVFKEFEGQLTAELFGHESSSTGDYDAHATSDPTPRYGKENEVYETLKAEGLRIPENLIAIGTVNMDETTHQFSRKVIDRAMTIEMNIADGEAPFMSFFDDYEELAYVDNPLGKDLFLPKFVSADEALVAMDEEDRQFLKDELPGKLAALNRALNGTPFKIAYRVQNELILYFAALRADSPDVEKEKLLATAIDSILMMKVLPRIEGDVDLLKEPLKALADYTASYPQSADKVKEMADRLDRGQFTSFWP